MHQMKLRPKATIITLGIALVVSLLFNFILYKTPAEIPTKNYREYFGEYIRLAEAAWVQENRPVGTEELKGRYPVAIELVDRVCVSLELKPGTIGGVPAYCFSKSDRAIKDVYKGGE